MNPNQPGLKDTLLACRAAVKQAIQKSQPFYAWENLYELDGDGSKVGLLPYTPQSLAGFEAAYAAEPENIQLAHHLAVAHHACAWDLELQNDPACLEEWKKALSYWRKVSASSEFWSRMKAQLAACDPDADPAFLGELRRGLYENLLDIHVDFIRYYCESGAPERAAGHVEIIRQAEIPPAVKKRLEEKVFEAMTGNVPESRAIQAFDSALISLERFLALFPAHAHGLVIMAEICKDWTGSLSFKEDWDVIQSIMERAQEPMSKLGRHPQLSSEALARPALEELCQQIILLAAERGNLKSSASNPKAISAEDRDQACQAFDAGLWWGRLGLTVRAPDSTLGESVAAVLNNYAWCCNQESNEILHSDLDERLKIKTVIRLNRKAVAMLEEAVSHCPDETTYSANLKSLKSELARLEGINLSSFFTTFEDEE